MSNTRLKKLLLLAALVLILGARLHQFALAKALTESQALSEYGIFYCVGGLCAVLALVIDALAER